MFASKNFSSGVEWLLVGLGNPGVKYAHTRHNMGFLAVDLLAEREAIQINKLKFKATVNEVRLGGARVLVMKPQTFMNLSGEAVREAAQFYKIPPERIIVIYDDVSLPVGKLRLRPSGSAGGHNGIKNIILHLNTDQFPRIKVGVGAPAHPEHEMIDWVIGSPTPEERKVLVETLKRAVDAAACIIEQNMQTAMNKFN